MFNHSPALFSFPQQESLWKDRHVAAPTWTRSRDAHSLRHDPGMFLKDCGTACCYPSIRTGSPMMSGMLTMRLGSAPISDTSSCLQGRARSLEVQLGRVLLSCTWKMSRQIRLPCWLKAESRPFSSDNTDHQAMSYKCSLSQSLSASSLGKKTNFSNGSPQRTGGRVLTPFPVLKYLLQESLFRSQGLSQSQHNGGELTPLPAILLFWLQKRRK